MPQSKIVCLFPKGSHVYKSQLFDAGPEFETVKVRMDISEETKKGAVVVLRKEIQTGYVFFGEKEECKSIFDAIEEYGELKDKGLEKLGMIKISDHPTGQPFRELEKRK